jgi:hypothetical protein
MQYEKYQVRTLIGALVPGEIDTRCHAIPPNHNILLFLKGISSLSNISSHEHKKICSILLGLVVGLPAPSMDDPSCIIKLTCVLLDFLFIAQYGSHMTASIEDLHTCLATFHDAKAVFMDLKIQKTFKLPKLHSLSHYASSIQLFGMTDNYNTKQSECLHINLAKEAYHAMNRKDEYPQMTAWLECQERIEWHAIFINMKQDIQQHAWPQRIIGPPCACVQSVKMTDHPSAKAITYDDLKLRYSAPRFQDALADFIAQVNYPSARGNTLHKHAGDTLIPFCHVPVFHVIKFTEAGIAEERGVIDSVHAWLEKMNMHGQITPSCFDTILIQNPSQDTDQGRVKGN